MFNELVLLAVSRSVLDPEPGISFTPGEEGVTWEVTRRRDPPNNLKEVDVDDAEDVEDVEGGTGDRADRPNAGEDELNRIPPSLSSACGGRGQVLATRTTKGASTT